MSPTPQPNRWSGGRYLWCAANPTVCKSSQSNVRALLKRSAESFPESSGQQIKDWIAKSSPGSVFAVTVVLSLVGAIILLSILWETIRFCRRKSRLGGWRQLEQAEAERRFQAEQTSEARQFAVPSQFPNRAYDPPPASRHLRQLSLPQNIKGGSNYAPRPISCDQASVETEKTAVESISSARSDPDLLKLPPANKLQRPIHQRSATLPPGAAPAAANLAASGSENSAAEKMKRAQTVHVPGL